MSTARKIANVMVMWDDVLQGSAVTINDTYTSATTTGFDAENILDPNRQTLCKFSGTGNLQITISLGASQRAITGMGIFNHNFGTKGAGNLYIGYCNTVNGTYTWLYQHSVQTIIGDDDFFHKLDGTTSAPYWRIFIGSIDTAGAYLGRLFLANDAYQIPEGLGQGSVKGYTHIEDVTRTLGGIEHRQSRSGLGRTINGVIPYASEATKTQIDGLIEHCQLNDKTFVISDPYGTTTYTAPNVYGSAIHARLDVEEYEYAMQYISRSHLPLPIVEVL